MANQSPSYEEIQSHILAKATKDTAFRQALLAEPNGAIQAELSARYPGLPALPAGLNIKVVEQTKDTVYMVLPPAPSGVEGSELSDAELAGVAGGYPSMTCSDTCGLGTSFSVC
jgi:hypothetical protein